jgi:fermentation-respiration switch protein FrsA (DUF1100 family)
VLIIGGTRDANVTPAFVELLYQSANEPKTLWVVPDAGHGDYAKVAAAEYARRLTGFFADALR